MRMFNLQKYDREYADEGRLPTLVKLKPTVEEEKKPENLGKSILPSDDTVIDDPKVKNDYIDRPWRQKLNPALATEKKNQKYYMQRLEAKASVCPPYSDKHDILVQHVALTIQIRKDFVQTLQQLLPKFPKDKNCSVKLLDIIMSLSENTERVILEDARKPQDVFIFPNY